MILDTLTLIAFGGNVVVGALIVFSMYAAMERSIVTGAITTVGIAFTAVLVEHWLALRIVWTDLAALQTARLASVTGAIIGAMVIILAFQPEMEHSTQASQAAGPEQRDRSTNERTSLEES